MGPLDFTGESDESEGSNFAQDSNLEPMLCSRSEGLDLSLDLGVSICLRGFSGLGERFVFGFSAGVSIETFPFEVSGMLSLGVALI